jgi:hypothetical protein
VSGLNLQLHSFYLIARDEEIRLQQVHTVDGTTTAAPTGGTTEIFFQE